MSHKKKLKVLLIASYHYGNMAVRLLQAIVKEKGHLCDALFFKSSERKKIKNSLYNFPVDAQEDFALPSSQDYAQFKAFIQETKPDLIGFNVMSFYFPIVAELSRLAKGVAHVPIVWGGAHPTIAPEDCAGYTDFICLGEGYRSLPGFIDAVADNCDLKTVEGFGYYREKGQLVINKNPPMVTDLDALPFADFTPKDKYYLNYGRIERQAQAWLFPGSMDAPFKTYHTIMASLGCPFKCTYCINSIKPVRLRRRSVDNVIAELKKVRHDNPHLRIVIFYDDIFTLDKAWCEEFAEKYRDKINLPFMCHVHPMVDKDMLKRLREAGLISVAMGIQTGSAGMRKIMARPEKDEHIINTAQNLSQLGSIKYQGYGHLFQIFYDLITHNPLDTPEDLDSTLRLLGKLPRNFVLNQYALSYFPNFPLTEKILKAGLIQPEDIEGSGKKQGHKLTSFLAGYDPKDFYFIAFSLTQYRLTPTWLIRHLADGDFWPQRIPWLMRIARLIRFLSILMDMGKYRKSLGLFKPVPGWSDVLS